MWQKKGELEECKEKLKDYKKLIEIRDKCEISIQDRPFKKTDNLLSKKYFNVNEPLLEKKLYKFLHFDQKLRDGGLLVNNLIDINLPPIDNLDELKDFWRDKDSKEREEIIKEYLKLIVFSHHFKIKQLINSLFSLINNRRLLPVVLICRALFEHVAVLNSYYEAYKILVKNKNSNPTFQKFENGKIIRGEVSESFKTPLNRLNKDYKDIENLPEFIFCALAQRYLIVGRKDLRLYEKYKYDWKNVFESKENLGFEQEEKILELPQQGVALDITFLENKIPYAKKWYSVICEFVHPNAGSHRTVIFEKGYSIEKDGEIIDAPDFETLKEEKKKTLKEIANVVLKYKLCSISSYDIEQNYAFIVEASYYPLIELIDLSIKVIDELIQEL